MHTLGPGVSEDTEEAGYLQMTDWKINGLMDSWEPIFETRRFLESSWAAVYPSLSAIMNHADSRPDFILSDYLVDAVRDMKAEYDIPIAMHWPQMPTNMLPTSYIPGVAGLQVEILTSEYATIGQRLKNELKSLRALPAFFKYRRWLRALRTRAGVTRMLPHDNKPDYLLLVNSFFGITTPKDLPPNVAAVGPILSEEYPLLTEPHNSFVQDHRRILYIALGTHVLLRDNTLRSILHGIADALDNGVIDGVTWSLRGMARKQLNLTARAPGYLGTQYSIASLLNDGHPNIKFVEFAPQRALLEHPHTCVFITHAGNSSTNEAMFHGVPTITVGVYFDQLQNSMRLRDAGVSILLDKHNLNSHDVCAAITKITLDCTGNFARNLQRVKNIARIAARRKLLAVDLMEEILADHEGRRGSDRPMHLQTADMRMPSWKAKNWDLWAVLGGSAVLGAVGIFSVVVMLRLLCS